MTLTVINKDILTATSGLICHQTNCIGATGGLAGAIFNKWPEAKNDYLHDVKTFKEGLLGTVSISVISDTLTLVNMFAQSGVSHKNKATQYSAFGACLYDLKAFYNNPTEIYFPYLIGCGLGGGDWNIVSEMIEEVFPNAIICKFQP